MQEDVIMDVRLEASQWLVGAEIGQPRLHPTGDDLPPHHDKDADWRRAKPPEIFSTSSLALSSATLLNRPAHSM